MTLQINRKYIKIVEVDNEDILVSMRCTRGETKTVNVCFKDHR